MGRLCFPGLLTVLMGYFFFGDALANYPTHTSPDSIIFLNNSNLTLFSGKANQWRILQAQKLG